VEGQGGGPARVGGRRAFSSSLSLCVTSVGNLPALFRPGPSSRGICLITDSDARKAAYFLAARARRRTCAQPHAHLHATPVGGTRQCGRQGGCRWTSPGHSSRGRQGAARGAPSFFTSFLFLFSFFSSSTDMVSTPIDLASSQCLWSPSTHTYPLARGAGQGGLPSAGCPRRTRRRSSHGNGLAAGCAPSWPAAACTAA